MMKVILSSEQAELALRFRDYIRQRYQRDLPLYQEQNVYLLAVEQDDPQLTALLGEAEQYRRDPFDEKYTQASWQDGETYSLQGRFSSWLPNIGNWRNALRQAPLTWTLALLCVAVYLLTLSGYRAEVYQWAHYPENSSQYSQLWRFVSHALVHLSFSHILFNLTYWLVFGAMIERKNGSGKLFMLFFAAAVISGSVQNAFSGAAFFGLSGVVFAVLGYVYLLSRLDPQQRYRLPSGFIYLLLIGVLFGFVSPLVDIAVGNAAHISGLMVGLALAWWQAHWQK
ncbi:rhomboid family intramembrane serine protease [Testudinibacter sp. P80/BLE/0925]|uniref:rhomboid family intramembrane serine protease n=1 Tax=Testudinibacter sp. TW-1 TaxID=3417757 RepID=UPI003D36995F